ncbi:MAG: GntR family transcriptional regulator [Firmicutes bacterium]|nr:GntR family transcriptional regulator [Bacillota bacterium]MDD4264653.1 GntR family transcriptional regulator [Bacillota bacterium]MDD4694275.1 GntR family transcriptional regulator [Bacillota bacterium]
MDFNPERPIYLQIIDEIKKRIVRGDLKPSEKLPSQRELATIMSVNPNTVQRAYKELEDAKIAQTLRGQGTFISSTISLKELQNELASEALEEFLTQMSELGLSHGEIKELLVRSLQERTE